MTNVQTLLAQARARGVTFRLAGDSIKVEAQTEPDPETKALLAELRQHREEVQAILTAPPCWKCGAPMTETCDIYGREWWACWVCAKTA